MASDALQRIEQKVWGQIARLGIGFALLITVSQAASESTHGNPLQPKHHAPGKNAADRENNEYVRRATVSPNASLRAGCDNCFIIPVHRNKLRTECRT